MNGQLLGLTNLQPNGGGINVNITFNEEDCGCVDPNPGPGGTVRWEDITNKPACILDCAVLLEYIHTNGLFNLQDSDEIVVEVDELGINRLFLVPRGVEGTYGSAAKTITVTVNDKGVVTAIEEVDIEIASEQVTYTNESYPSVSNVKEILDQLVLVATRQTYVHNQISAATVWTINHNMGKRPSITILDAAGDLSFARPAYSDLNNLTLTFSEATTGVAYLN